MSDPSDASGTRHRRRRDPKLGDGGAPVANVVVLAAAATAVIAGFLILRSVTDPNASSDETGTTVAPTVTAVVTSTTVSAAPAATTEPSTSTTTTTLPPASKSDAIVVVVNASGVDRSATAMAEELSADGYSTAPVANSTGPYLERSVIYYLAGDTGALGVARLLAEQIPTAQTMPMPQPPPLDRPLDEATVALMLGTDAAGRPLTELVTD